MLLALGFGSIASVALVLGSLVGINWSPSRRFTGVLLAFASGTLIAALAFELFPLAVESGGLTRSTLGLIAGAAVFVVFNSWLDKKVAPVNAAGEKAEETEVIREGASRGLGFALLASVTLMAYRKTWRWVPACSCMQALHCWWQFLRQIFRKPWWVQLP